MLKKFFYSIAIVLFCGQLAASKGTDEAKQFIEDLGRRAIESLTKPGISQSELRSRFRSLLEEGFNVPAIARFVMGRYWRTMEDSQKETFIPLFEDRLVTSYANRFQEYQGVSFEVSGAYFQGETIIVKSTIQKPGGPRTAVDWRVFKNKIHDVRVEGVSMSVTIRDEYNSLVASKNGNIDAFLASLGSGKISKSMRVQDSEE
ncbi:MAG: ABC transporter substrate-binding protein [Alphaproteobacteria bacterium]|nr:ABC transporter substrate-binding protein [Alphaproteobacteria bacterium]